MAQHPIWSLLRHQGRYNLVWLAERTGFSHSHVKAIATGRYTPSPEFRRRCAHLLDLPESALFVSVDRTATAEVA